MEQDAHILLLRQNQDTLASVEECPQTVLLKNIDS